jgi:hypothetical protein
MRASDTANSRRKPLDEFGNRFGVTRRRRGHEAFEAHMSLRGGRV